MRVPTCNELLVPVEASLVHSLKLSRYRYELFLAKMYPSPTSCTSAESVREGSVQLSRGSLA